MRATPRSTLADPEQHVADLQRQLAESRAELDQALAREAAIAEVLGVINSSAGDLEPVFEALLANAVEICGGIFGMMAMHEGDVFHGVAAHRVGPEFPETLSRLGRPPPGTGLRMLQERLETVQISDAANNAAYDPVRALNPAFARVRTALHVPMVRDGALVGAILIYRDQVQPFRPKQIALVESFATQALIAIENARLLTETREALEQQTATADVLGVINSSPGDLAPVFDVMLEKATTLCGAAFGIMNTFDGERFHTVALHGVPQPLQELLLSVQPQPAALSGPGRLLRGEDFVRTDDVAATLTYQSGDVRTRALVDLGGAHSYMAVPLTKDGKLLGTIAAYRQEVRPFSDKQIALLQNFAAQAVIAMENARLLGETREALEQQTATAEVLG
jgi:GAF domain-containing protein